jgi:hypothetical protein
MIQGRGRGVADRGRMPRRRGDVLVPGALADALVGVGRVAMLAGAFGIGWLIASHIDPGGWLLRYTLGWLVGGFR